MSRPKRISSPRESFSPTISNFGLFDRWLFSASPRRWDPNWWWSGKWCDLPFLLSSSLRPSLGGCFQIIDLFFFTYIIVIAMTAYGVASRSMYNYNADNDTDDLSFDGRSVFRHIIYPSYYLMYGSTDKELEALDSTFWSIIDSQREISFLPRIDDQSAGGSIATQVLLAFHMLFVNILLINLLIAMFR